MEIYSKIFSGFFAYLLIAQIFVVTGLLLYLLGMMARRISRLSSTEGAAVAQSTVVVAQVTSVNADLEKELRDKITKLESENSQLASGGNKDQTGLVDKVKYLESKLLEYEILQEEIGQLSNLKNENETLRTRVQELETQSKASPVKAA